MHINGIKTRHTCSVLLASANLAKYAHWNEILSGITSFSCADTLDLLGNKLLQLRPEVLLLDRDLPGLDDRRIIPQIRKLCPETCIVILKESATDEVELAMLKAGVRGICSPDIGDSTLWLMINSVLSGELWIRRSLTCRLLEQLREGGRFQTEASPMSSQLKGLTHREYEIAMRVGNGESNKHIAHSLEISESTVKAHLTKIFRKTGVTDRLKVAKMLSTQH